MVKNTQSRSKKAMTIVAKKYIDSDSSSKDIYSLLKKARFLPLLSLRLNNVRKMLSDSRFYYSLFMALFAYLLVKTNLRWKRKQTWLVEKLGRPRQFCKDLKEFYETVSNAALVNLTISTITRPM